ncbi:MAG: universal stress protein [Promethearchaeota archaeon]
MYKKILVGVDESQDAMDAVKKALELEKGENSEIVVFHSVVHNLAEVSPSFSLVGPSNASVSLIIHEDNVNQGKKTLKEVERLFKDANLAVETRLIFDIPPEDYIKNKIEEEKFDLVILGCKGKHSKLKRVLLGTIPTKVINSADCDVLIVR